MQAQLIRSDLDVTREAYTHFGEDFVRENSTPSPLGQWLYDRPLRRWKWGVVLDHPLVWKLVRNGEAIPVDDECRDRSRLTPAQLEEAQARREKLATEGSYEDEIRAKARSPKIIDEDDDE